MSYPLDDSNFDQDSWNPHGHDDNTSLTQNHSESQHDLGGFDHYNTTDLSNTLSSTTDSRVDAGDWDDHRMSGIDPEPDTTHPSTSTSAVGAQSQDRSATNHPVQFQEANQEDTFGEYYESTQSDTESPPAKRQRPMEENREVPLLPDQNSRYRLQNFQPDIIPDVWDEWAVLHAQLDDAATHGSTNTGPNSGNVFGQGHAPVQSSGPAAGYTRSQSHSTSAPHLRAQHPIERPPPSVGQGHATVQSSGPAAGYTTPQSHGTSAPQLRAQHPIERPPPSNVINPPTAHSQGGEPNIRQSTAPPQHPGPRPQIDLQRPREDGVPGHPARGDAQPQPQTQTPQTQTQSHPHHVPNYLFADLAAASLLANDPSEAELRRLRMLCENFPGHGLPAGQAPEFAILADIFRDIGSGRPMLPSPHQLAGMAGRVNSLDITFRLAIMTTLLHSAIELLQSELLPRLRQAILRGNALCVARIVTSLLHNDSFAHIHTGDPQNDPTRADPVQTAQWMQRWMAAFQKAQNSGSHRTAPLPPFGHSIRILDGMFVVYPPLENLQDFVLEGGTSITFHYVSRLIMAMSLRVIGIFPSELSRQLVVQSAKPPANGRFVFGPSIMGLSTAFLRVAFVMLLPGSGSCFMLSLDHPAYQYRLARLVNAQYCFRVPILDWLYTSTSDYFSLHMFLIELRATSRRESAFVRRLLRHPTMSFSLYNPHGHRGVYTVRPGGPVAAEPIEPNDDDDDTSVEAQQAASDEEGDGTGNVQTLEKGKAKDKANQAAYEDEDLDDEWMDNSDDDDIAEAEERDMERAAHNSLQTHASETQQRQGTSFASTSAHQLQTGQSTGSTSRHREVGGSFVLASQSRRRQNPPSTGNPYPSIPPHGSNNDSSRPMGGNLTGYTDPRAVSHTMHPLEQAPVLPRNSTSTVRMQPTVTHEGNTQTMSGTVYQHHHQQSTASFAQMSDASTLSNEASSHYSSTSYPSMPTNTMGSSVGMGYQPHGAALIFPGTAASAGAPAPLLQSTSAGNVAPISSEMTYYQHQPTTLLHGISSAPASSGGISSNPLGHAAPTSTYPQAVSGPMTGPASGMDYQHAQGSTIAGNQAGYFPEFDMHHYSEGQPGWYPPSAAPDDDIAGP